MPDLNLLITLDVLLEEKSVTRAAERLGMSAPALSRALARVRETLGDPILVRAGRQLVPTKRATELRDRVRQLVEDASVLLRPEKMDSFDRLDRHFTIRSSETIAGAFAVDLLSALKRVAPLVSVRFAPEGEGDDEALREGRIDIHIGALRKAGPEVRVQTLFRDSVVGVARIGHPIFEGGITPERFVQFDQISASRRGRARGPIDDALNALGLERRLPLVLSSFNTVAFAVSTCDLIGVVPRHVLLGIRRLEMNLRTFELPVKVESVVMAQAWHPRLDNDPPHRLLRSTIREITARSSLPTAETEQLTT
jgi:DNA-binding transcriptional LysR family regulator